MAGSSLTLYLAFTTWFIYIVYTYIVYRTCLERPPHSDWPQKCGLSRQVVSHGSGLSRQVSLYMQIYSKSNTMYRCRHFNTSIQVWGSKCISTDQEHLPQSFAYIYAVGDTVDALFILSVFYRQINLYLTFNEQWIYVYNIIFSSNTKIQCLSLSVFLCNYTVDLRYIYCSFISCC